MKWDDHKKELMKNPEFRKAWKEFQPEYQVARALIMARMEKKLTQKELAKKLNTKQSVISRVENANTSPSLSFLKKLAAALGTHLEIRFRPL